MAGVVQIPWYATVLRQESFAEQVCQLAPVALRYGATQYSVQRSRDDRYKITQMAWFQTKADWYHYWDSPEMIEFRARNSGHFQIPVIYVWHDELVSGALAPQVALEPAPGPAPQAAPRAAV
ncbi:MAG: hypothetical protein M3Y17_01245 [Actinomycetota bacterium]|nr:hypothetical protein [Actinomycetota bacterium]